MFKNLKFIGVLVLSVLLLTNCNKDAKQDKLQEGELTFATIDIDPDKAIECQEDMAPTHAVVKIKDDQGVETTYYPLTFYLDGELFTQAIKLPAGDYTLEEFVIVYHPNNLDADDHSGDVPLKATPMAGSPYAAFLEYGGLARDINIAPFQKYHMWIEVLCYIPADWQDFGFQWFHVHEIIIREQCFFGDFCIKHTPDYVGSLYEEGGIQMDEIAIFAIRVYRQINGTDQWEYLGGDDNEDSYGSGEPFCIQYADRVGVDDNYAFELYVYVKTGPQDDDPFGYELMQTWYFSDDGVIENGGDGVTEFVVGNCNYSDTDFLIPPWMNLPCSVDYSVATNGEAYDSYFASTFDGIPAGYDIGNGTFGGWCADLQHFITPGTQYDMCAFSSLRLDLLPESCNMDVDWSERGEEFARVNWLFNNLDLLPARTTNQMQDAIWKLMGFNPGLDGVSAQIVALAIGHGDFTPVPGGWAAVLLYHTSDADCVNVQITFRVVDP